jgi:imidazole glycerol-phosphate synthase subunit HisH
MITIVDYGMGNLGSIGNMLKKIGVESQTSSDPEVVARAGKLILPGVGAFDAGMENLERSGLQPVLEERVRAAEVPTLGICLGMQLMTRRSEEGVRLGLGWVDAEVLRIVPGDGSLKVPHMGWNVVQTIRSSPLTEDLPEGSRFYFVHSFHVHCKRPDDILLTTPYGGDLHSAFRHRNVWGVQFHPEKSHRFGMQLLRSFAERC